MKFINQEVFLTGIEERVTQKGNTYCVVTVIGCNGGSSITCMYTGDFKELEKEYLQCISKNPFVPVFADFEYTDGQYSRFVSTRIVIKK